MRYVSFTAEAHPDKNCESRRIVAAEPLTCLTGTFGEASRLLEKIGDCGLSDFQVVGSVRLRGGHENMKSIGPLENMSLMCYYSPRTGSTKGFHSAKEKCSDLAQLVDLLWSITVNYQTLIQLKRDKSTVITFNGQQKLKPWPKKTFPKLMLESLPAF